MSAPDASLQKWLSAAHEAGFSAAAALDVSTLSPLAAVRAACEQNKCGKYAACWTCPPGCGTLAECAVRIGRYTHGLLVQTTGTLTDPFDYPAMRETETAHAARFAQLCDTLRMDFPDMLPLGAGCCTLCAVCTYPDAPCRFPQRAYASMEAYGLLVSDVCIKNELPYSYGKNTVAFTGCCLF